MILIALLIGVVLVVAAIRGTEGTLLSALGQDIPAYVVWAAAIVALGAIGYVPALKPISRGLLALVLIVIVLRNYKGVIAGFSAVATPPAPAAPSTGSGSAPSTSALPSLNSSQAVATPSTVAPTASSPFGDLIDNVGLNFNQNTAPSTFASEYLHSFGAGGFP